MKKIISGYKNGMITEAEALLALDRLQIQGAFRSKISDKYFFIGFDYKNQTWITID